MIGWMPDVASLTLLDRAQAGDRDALETLLTRHQARIYRFGLRMCRDPEDARDVLQDTLFAMARGIRDFRGASSMSTWLYTIARSFCIKKRRRSKFAPIVERSIDTDAGVEAAELTDPAKNPHDTLADKQVEAALATAIGELAPKYREVLLLRDVEGLSAAEVAEVLGLSVQAVKSRLHRARLSVRACVAPLLGVPEEPASAAPGTCPDVLVLFSRYLEGEIAPEVCADMERHLDTCGACRGVCDSLRHTLALCRTTGAAVPVPVAVQSSVRIALRNFLTRQE
jgi:RNA polymerase sigma-70 factor (ECF subfamily)